MNHLSTDTLFFILFVLILISAFFSGSETALVSLNRYKLKYLSKSGHKGAKLAYELLQRPDRLIGLILIFNNFVNILASAIATIIGLRIFGESGIAYATGLLTLVILVFAEVTPKTFAAAHPERLAFPAAFVIKPLLKLMYPLVAIINLIGNNLLKLLGMHNNQHSLSMNKDEFRSIINETGHLIPEKHQRMLLNILDLEAVTVNDIMIPRHEITAINIEDSWEDIKHQLSNSLHTRLPVYEGDIDKIIGIIHIKNTLPLISNPQSTLEDLKKIIRPAYFVPESTSLNQQLLKFQQKKRRVAFVVDEYGDFQGLITLEDVLEEIVGEFTSDPNSTLSEDIYPQEDGSYLIEASINVRELNRALHWHLPTDSAKTLNGVLLEYLESIPQVGTSILINQYPIEIIKIQNNSIKTVKIYPQLEKTEEL